MNIAECIYENIKRHPPDYGNADSILGMLYSRYNECNGMDTMDAIGLVICYGAMVCMYLLMGVIVLWGIYLILKVLFGKDDVTPMTANQKSCLKSGPIVYDWSDADEAQSRAMRAATQAHEDSVRLHNLAVRDAQEAHTMACDMHAAAVEMHNDFACNSCDPWF